MKTDEQKYYQRQIILPEITEKGQELLKTKKVMVVGAGGLGCPVLEYLTRAGVGEIALMDYDKVDITNLHRQTLYSYNDVGKYKSKAAIDRLKEINPFIQLTGFCEAASKENIVQRLMHYDVVVDTTDNYPTRYLINDACVLANKPLVYGAIYRFEGQLSVFNYQGGATYRCLFPKFPESKSTVNCAEAGVIGILPGIIGLMQANETLKILLDSPNICSNKLITYQAKTGLTQSITIRRNPEIDYKTIIQGKTLNHPYYHSDCRYKREISEEELIHDIKHGVGLMFVDVREQHELPKFVHPLVVAIPMSKFKTQVSEIPKAQKTVLFCKSGLRSSWVQEKLADLFPDREFISLRGGITPQIIEVWNQNH